MASETRSSVSHRMLRSTASNYVGEAAAVLATVLLTPFILHRVGVEHYALWALATALVSYGAVLDLGISGAVVKYVAEHRARGEVDEASRLVATALTLYTGLGLLAFALSGMVAVALPQVVDLSGGNRDLAASLILLSGFGLGVGIPCSTALSVLRGLQRFDVANLLAVGGILLTSAGTVAVLLLGGGVIGLVAVGVATTLVMQVPSVWFVRRLAPDLDYGWRGASLGLARRVLSFSSSIAGIQFAGILTTRLDAVVVGSALRIEAVVPYVLAQKLAQFVELFTKQFLKVILPFASEMQARNDAESLRRLYLSATRVTLAASLPIAAVVGTLAPQILSVWVGEEYAEFSHLVVILAANGVLDTMLWPGLIVLMAMERHRPLVWMAIGNGFANLALSIILVGPFGLAGVAYGTLLPTIAEAFLVFIPYAMRTIGVSLVQIMKEVFLPVAIPGLVLTAVLVIVREATDGTRPVVLASLVVAGGALYTAVYLAVGASHTERAFYRSLAVSARRLARRSFSGGRMTK